MPSKPTIKTILPKFSSHSYSLNKYHKIIKFFLSLMASMMLGDTFKAKVKDVSSKLSLAFSFTKYHKIIKIFLSVMACMMLGDAFKAKVKDLSSKIFLKL